MKPKNCSQIFNSDRNAKNGTYILFKSDFDLNGDKFNCSFNSEGGLYILIKSY